MAKFLNREGIIASISEIIAKSENRVVIISPFIKIPEELMQRLKDADKKRNIKILVVCRENGLHKETQKRLEGLNNLKLAFLSNLHAKCFHNENFVVITSLNLYDARNQSSNEMGVLLTVEDGDVFSDAKAEAAYIIRQAMPSEEEITNSKSYISKIRIKHKRAYEKWTEEEEEQLKYLWELYLSNKTTISEIATKLGRQPSAVKARLDKIGIRG
jgi:hypothetical protein